MERLGLTIDQEILILAGILATWVLITYSRMSSFINDSRNAPKISVKATLLSKDLKPGSYKGGKAVMDRSWIVIFETEDNKYIELLACKDDIVNLNTGTDGLLTYKGKQFIEFDF